MRNHALFHRIDLPPVRVLLLVHPGAGMVPDDAGPPMAASVACILHADGITEANA